MAEKTIAILVAGGTSQRLESPIPKPYQLFYGEPVLLHSLRTFMSHPLIDGVRVVIRREHHALYKKVAAGLTLFPCVVGGNSRQESVRLGLESIEHRMPERVLVHDVARPLVSHAIISRVLERLDHSKAVIPVVPVVDTIKTRKNDHVGMTLSRDELMAVQTPQGFDYQLLLSAHRRFKDEQFTDDAALMEKALIPVATVDGDVRNKKITTTQDLTTMQPPTHAFEYRTGIGYDVHALKVHDEETPVGKQQIKLCGVKIPHTHFLVGHSDADVGLHALVDAILGAIGAGDIGIHFPPDDLQWKGADSSRFLMHAYELVKARGGEIVHLDLTLICERPKIAPYREAMITRIAQNLKINESRVSVKATTTEKLGFTGRAEGVAAQAVATIRLPII
ncbi:MAG: bifunctional 2-C-methyl-D-erythritol 4-phosphate cytidylyltransferase/2-C-methyl-D-erythritol 2,4-cyclodiphosphate synthase [Rickettsiales bacterium]|jgi:2-C-methyl-D-erythritol 4-phosphate cytidylyltransferase/2-C-methyl-D-erythritol 2,4-cyclodiphosphate synthase|nr:bifunctional 2-C-methyl-D-erythritol 4-phosphate cytidylyltransferase/2-C-methyl-D-erythritol 2,4-cyclodiphosphate synthase [Rickettsiales bacterium]